jgi:hypothetical protein
MTTIEQIAAALTKRRTGEALDLPALARDMCLAALASTIPVARIDATAEAIRADDGSEPVEIAANRVFAAALSGIVLPVTRVEIIDAAGVQKPDLRALEASCS